MTVRPIVYFPIESTTRELASRLLLARFLLRFGFRIVIGFNDAVISGSGRWPRGAYFLKGMNAVQKRMASIFKQQGYLVLAIDEEALGISDEWFLTKDVDTEISSMLDLVFCQGVHQREALKAQRGFSDSQLVISGNPRTDLLTPPLVSTLDREVTWIKERHGRFVLINTNSGSINNLWGDLSKYLNLLVEIGWYDPENPEDQALVDDHLEHDRNNFSALRELIRTLSVRRPDMSFVVRPHPSEVSKVWGEFTEGFPNVTVVSDTEPAPWLRAANVILTTGCTTGLEAVLLGKPTVSLVSQPDHIRHPSFFIANQISVVCRSVTDASRLLQDHWDKRVDLARVDENSRLAALDKHIATSSDILGGERIAQAIAKCDFKGMDNRRALFISPEQDNYLRKKAKKVRWAKGSFTNEEIRDWLALFDDHLGAGEPVNIRDIGWSTFELTPSEVETESVGSGQTL